MILRNDFKLSGTSVSRVGTYPDRHSSRFDLKLVLIAPDCEGLRRKCKTHVLRFTWSERHPFKSLQGSYRLRHARTLEANVKLDNFFARSLTAIRNWGRDSHSRIFSPMKTCIQRGGLQFLTADLNP